MKQSCPKIDWWKQVTGGLASTWLVVIMWCFWRLYSALVSLLRCLTSSSAREASPSFQTHTSVNIRISVVFYLPLSSCSTRALRIAILLQRLLWFRPLGQIFSLHRILSNGGSLGSLKDFRCIDQFLLLYIVFSLLVVRFDFSYVATYIKWSAFRFFTIEWVCWDNSLRLPRLQLQNYCMHPKDGAILTTAREKLFATDSTSYDITHKRVAFGQICCEIHLLPLISFFNPQAGKAKIGTDRVRTYEINLSI